MVPAPFIVRTVEDLRKIARGWRTNRNKTAIVPTMGALHRGHLALVQEAFRRADKVAVSIFVNPKQFGRGEDLSRYPRNETADQEMLANAGVNLIFAPSPQTIYPPGFATTVTPAGPAKAGLEDKFRPQFFDGVATVVAKLLISAECDFAMFGEKDYQQLKLVGQLVRDLNIATEIIPVPTLREADGLAMSSRNFYLSSAQRSKAPGLNSALNEAAAAIRAGKNPARASAAARRSLEAQGFRIDYLT
ncbi:MAG TPA: pantoate--beta-alanine ligase, partial [Aestuariivirgaceae bacterium]|nr:pantoate--beta-alanine ligase [Aestuariivirgaceae bacterium]